jgi:hypothetical protein
MVRACGVAARSVTDRWSRTIEREDAPCGGEPRTSTRPLPGMGELDLRSR